MSVNYKIKKMSLFNSIIFGPIKSRRLGNSLGVNLLPDSGKVCTFDCIYCECGYNKDNKGGKIPSKERVVEEMALKFEELSKKGEELDVITFAGNGEPTLHPDFSEIIDSTIELRDKYFPDAKISVLSNSTETGKNSVFEALKKVDNNILKLDSTFAETVNLIDKPVNKSYDINNIIDNLSRFNGKAIVQTMFLRGEHNGQKVDNTTDKEVDALIEAYKKISPKQIMIYSLDRPTPEKKLIKVEKSELEEIATKMRNAGFDVVVG